DELAFALQQIATEEFGATQSMANEISSGRMQAIMTRLLELRGGVGGFSLSGLGVGSLSHPVGEELRSTTGSGMLGGAAGDAVLGSALGGFLNISYGTGERDDTNQVNAFDYDNYQLVAGVDYRFNDNLVLGGALNYYRADSDFNKVATVSGGGIETDGWGGTFYASYTRDDFYLEGTLGYAVSDYDIRRRILIAPAIDETAKGTPESRDLSFSIGAGYSIVQGPLTYGPYGRINYSNVDVDSYRETGAEASGLNLDVDSQTWKSLTSVVGMQFSYAVNSSYAVWLPQAKVGWVHQFENDATEMNAVYVNDPRGNILSATTDDPDRDYFELGLGVSAVFRGGMQAFLNYDTLLGFRNLQDHLFTLGARWEF
ncbi:MAG: autotransporter outer membrane beta-barrel domain-containing protein, partial [Gammaproteobacteria bacterium]|nr:autotransporter outer membrane beta-barrel domain-containing protein [Gammaproteobacteria bacterium]